MGAGPKQPLNVFKLNTGDAPREVLNWKLWFAVFSIGLMGAARGVDEGLITGAFDSKDFQDSINFSSYDTVEQANIRGNVSAMVQLGSVAGALFAFLICDRVGRIWAIRILTVIWIVGIAIFMAHNGLGAVYAGRFIAGIGVGMTPVVGPILIGELAPAAVRGLCTCVFTGFVYLGIVLAYFANYGCELNMGSDVPNRWLVPTSLHVMFAGIIFILSFFQIESPRYLVKKNQPEQALMNLARIRCLPPDHDYVVAEITSIQASHDAEMEATHGLGWKGVVKEALTVPSNLYRIYLATMVQVLSQWSGAGSITVYAPQLFSLLGISGSEESLLVTGVFGIVKFCAAIICALFLVDVIGRKRALLTGITLQAISMIYVAAYLTAIPELGTDDSFVLPDSKQGVSRGAIAMIYISGAGWALGWNSMQYLLTAELFPLRIRATCVSVMMTLHFANQYGNSRAVPNMLLPSREGGINPSGAFWTFAAITVAGGIWVWFSIPETAGRSLESMDALFQLPWYKIGLHGNKDAEQRDLAQSKLEEEKEIEMQNRQGQATTIERVA
ncbi:general substrate transporter [Aspergillus karnatakaensis]|uniref:putative MFS quinate transporter n=1 Tax=Aspergillus karnatakaensis TaxID=1810916 RepID=UPI003CCDA968